MPRVIRQDEYLDPMSAAGGAIAGLLQYQGAKQAMELNALKARAIQSEIDAEERARLREDNSISSMRRAADWMMQHIGPDRRGGAFGEDLERLGGGQSTFSMGGLNTTPKALARAGISLPRGPRGMQGWGWEYTPEQRKKIADAEEIVNRMESRDDIVLFMKMFQEEMQQEISFQQRDMVMQELSGFMQSLDEDLSASPQGAGSAGDGGGAAGSGNALAAGPDPALDPIRSQAESVIDRLGSGMIEPEAAWNELSALRAALVDMNVDMKMRVNTYSWMEMKKAELMQNYDVNVDKIEQLEALQESVARRGTGWEEAHKVTRDVLSDAPLDASQKAQRGRGRPVDQMPPDARAFLELQSMQEAQKLLPKWAKDALDKRPPTEDEKAKETKSWKDWDRASQFLRQIEHDSFIRHAQAGGWDVTTPGVASVEYDPRNTFDILWRSATIRGNKDASLRLNRLFDLLGDRSFWGRSDAERMFQDQTGVSVNDLPRSLIKSLMDFRESIERPSGATGLPVGDTIKSVIPKRDPTGGDFPVGG